MDIYKVNFEDNRPVSCVQVTVARCSELEEVGIEGSKIFIKWRIVDAEHEQHAIEVALQIIKQRWGGWIR